MYAYNITKSLSKHVDLTVFVPSIETVKTIDGDPGFKHFPIQILRAPLTQYPTFIYCSSKLVNASKFDIVHSNCGSGLLCEKLSIETFHHMPRNLKELVHAVPQRVALRRAKHIIAVSTRAKHELLNAGIAEDSISVIYEGVDCSLFSPSSEKRFFVRSKLGINHRRVILKIDSEMSKRKNLPLMLDTVKAAKDMNLEPFLIIIGPRRYTERVMELCKRAHLEEDVHYVSNVPLNEMPMYYNAADFIAVPSLYEGFGLPLVEAIAVAKPFVSMDVGIAADLAKKGFGKVAQSSEEFKDLCINMMKSPSIISKDGINFVKDNYNWDKVAEQTIEVYERIIGADASR